MLGVWRVLIPLLAVGCNRGCDRGALDPSGAGGGGVMVMAGKAGAPGVGGAAGATGKAGTGGFGGATCISDGLPVPPPVNCGDVLCGNGRRDSCIWSSPCGPQEIAEACDRSDLNGQSCIANGYLSGALVCAGDCTLDASACSACADAGPVPVACSNLSAGGSPYVRIAGTDTEIFVLMGWADGLRRNLWFERLSADLKERGSGEILGDTVVTTGGTLNNFDVAAFPGGWIVVGVGEGGMFIHAFDTDGVDRGRATVGAGATGSPGEGPRLVPRPDGPPLIAWVIVTSAPDGGAAGVLQTAVVGADGRSVGPTHGSAFEDWTRPHGLAFAGDAFVAAVVAGSPTNPGQIRIRRIETDGTPTTAVDALPGVNATAVSPVGCDGGLCLVYHAMIPPATNPMDAGFLWTKVDAAGAAVGNIAELSFWLDHDYSWATPVAIGSDTATLMGGEPDGTIGLTRVTSTGLQRVIDATVLRERTLIGYHPAIAVRGRDTVLAWAAAGVIRIARVGSPAP